jgi:hypothetical protein
MIDGIYTTMTMAAGDLPVGLVHVYNDTLGHGEIIKVRGHHRGYTYLGREGHHAFRIPSVDTVSVIDTYQDWHNLTTDDMIDIELDLMVRGA